MSNKNEVAYKIMKEFLINEAGFNEHTNFNELIHYIYLILDNTINKIQCDDDIYINALEITENTLLQYKRRLINSNVIKYDSKLNFIMRDYISEDVIFTEIIVNAFKYVFNNSEAGKTYSIDFKYIPF